MKARAWILTASTLMACVSTPPPPPTVPLPKHWSLLPAMQTRPGDRANIAFWDRFGCPELKTLLEAATQHSMINATAAANAAQSKALARVAEAPLYPTIGAEVALTFQSENSKSLGSVSGGFLDTGLVASYELDVWSQNRQTAAAAGFRSAASRHELASSKLDVAAGVAQTYFEILSLRERMTRAKVNFEATQRVLGIVEARERAGTALAREVAQQRALVASETTYVERIAESEAEARITLAIASGREPYAVSVEAQSLDVVADPSILIADIDVPGRMLTRRPDVAQAEALLAAANADLDAARAAILPNIRFTAAAAFQSVFLARESVAPGFVYTGTVALSQSIFDGGLWSANREAAKAERTRAEANYRQVVLSAVGEVERALRALDGLQKQYEHQGVVVDEARRAFNLVEIEYKAGAEELLGVIDAQRTLFQAEDDYGQIRLAKLRAAVALVKALGGGWSS
ncbi:MAG: efflux transporter outer membrane subunit [Polyangiales bacterium]